MRTNIATMVVLLLSLTVAFAQVDSLPVLPKTNVDIPWTELRGLIELSMQKDKPVLYPPVDYMISTAEYAAEISDNTLNGDVVFSIVVLREGYVEVPLFDLDLPLRSPKINGGPAPITSRGSKNTLILEGPGKYTFTTGFVMELPEHVTNFRLNIPRTSSTRFVLVLPDKELDVKLTPASRLSKRDVSGKTVVDAYLASTDYLFCEWMIALPEEAEEELEPVLYSEVQSLFSVGEGMVKGSIGLSYSIVQGKVDVLRFEVPKDVRILDVSSGHLRDWKMEEKDDSRIVSAYLKFPIGGNVALNCNLERSMEAVSATVNLPVISCLNVEREKGYIGVEATTNVEVSLLTEALDVATRIDRSELPQSLWGRASHPIILAFKYLETPYVISLDVEKHEDLPVKVATADNAAFVALMTRDGNYIVRGTYSVRNNLKQFLSLRLPEGSELWSLFVNGRPAKPGKGDENRILIPMEKSRGGGESTTFPVEIIFFVEGKKLGPIGNRSVILPKVDVPVSVMNLSLYLPYGYTYTGFGGNMEEASYYEGYGYDKGEAAAGGAFDMVQANVPVAKGRASMDAMLESQVAYEEEMKQSVQTFSSTEKGVYPVRINIPQVGTLHRFQKYILPEDEKGPYPEVKVRYSKRGIKNVLGFIMFILAVIAFWYFAKLVSKFFKLSITRDKKWRISLLIAILVGFAELIVLTLIADAFAVGKWLIYVPWCIGAAILAVYWIVKLIIKGMKPKHKPPKPTPPPPAPAEG